MPLGVDDAAVGACLLITTLLSEAKLNLDNPTKRKMDRLKAKLEGMDGRTREAKEIKRELEETVQMVRLPSRAVEDPEGTLRELLARHLD
jgi:hypothetical protein